MAQRPPGREHELVLLGLAVLIALVWATATLVQVVFPSHAVPTEVHFVMMSVAAFFFGGSVFTSIWKRNGKNGNGKDGHA
ncbi:MAG TPA: hypothetical protein VLA89_00305 [Gemmatimonadales bacterium]|nr:hypothetical protein [Gemmatimonadales bacterium]